MPTYHNPGMGQPIAFGSDGETLYHCVVSDRYLYSVPTALLHSQDPPSELLASGAVKP